MSIIIVIIDAIPFKFQVRRPLREKAIKYQNHVDGGGSLHGGGGVGSGRSCDAGHQLALDARHRPVDEEREEAVDGGRVLFAAAIAAAISMLMRWRSDGAERAQRADRAVSVLEFGLRCRGRLC